MLLGSKGSHSEGRVADRGLGEAWIGDRSGASVRVGANVSEAGDLEAFGDETAAGPQAASNATVAMINRPVFLSRHAVGRTIRLWLLSDSEATVMASSLRQEKFGLSPCAIGWVRVTTTLPTLPAALTCP